MPDRSERDNAAPGPVALAGAGLTRGLPGGFRVVFFGRLVTNVGMRMVFPFLPRISAGLGVSLGTIGAALSVQDAAAVSGPALGRVADRREHRAMMTLALVCLSVALVVVSSSSGVVMFTAGLVALALSKSLYDIASSAWLGNAVPFARRGRAIGLLEASWAAAFFAGMPAAALVIRAGTWRTPFVAVAVLSMVMAGVVLAVMAPAPTPAAAERRRLTWTPVITGATTTIALIGIGHQLLLVSFATWLDDEHGLDVSALGAVAIAIGLAELGGSLTTAAFADRVGTRRAVIAGSLALVPLSLLIPAGSASLGLAIVLIVVWFLAVEFSFVSLLSLFSELDTRARGTVLGVAFAAFTLGHAAGSLVGSQAYSRAGMNLVAVLMSCMFAGAATIAALVVVEPEA